MITQEEALRGCRTATSSSMPTTCQSLSPWREISADMFCLWCNAELDRLSPTCCCRLCELHSAVSYCSIWPWKSFLRAGRGGARLSHSHERQYAYVLQSLSLWREISTDMFRLWYLAELDLLSSTCRYRLCDTGQGLHRVQPARQVAKAMAQILARCQQQIGTWVGSSVVHLGDSNVPNALMFIDKYTQVRRASVAEKIDSNSRLCVSCIGAAGREGDSADSCPMPTADRDLIRQQRCAFWRLKRPERAHVH